MNLTPSDRGNLVDKHSASLIALAEKNMLVAIAPNVENPEVLIAGVLPGAEILLLNDSEDGITQISRALAANPAQTLSIVCHGSSGKLDLGKTLLDRYSLPRYQQQLEGWGISELVLYACEVGQDRDFIAQLSEQTGARVVSALGKVGNAALGGNWQLEDSSGEIIETLAFNQQARQTYTGVLVSFSAQTTFATGTSPNSMAAGDFNGDSKTDLAVANYDSSNVSVLLGNGSGGFSAQTNFAAGNGSTFVAVGDFNGDSKTDLVVANFISNNISVLLGNGSGGFSPQTTFATGNNPESVSVGDFNGDSKPDLAVAINPDNISVLLGNGSGGFGSQNTFSAGNRPRSVAVGDFNGDGNPDLAAANFNSDNVSVLLGNGSGGFSAQTTFRAGNGSTFVAVGDFNGDSKPDLAVANFYAGNVSVLLGNGSGGFSAQSSFAVRVSPATVAVGDFNGDSKPDLAVANINSREVSVLLGNGSGSFSAQTAFSAGTTPYSVVVGDFNGDSKPDLAVTNFRDDNVSVLLNTTDTTPPTVTNIDDGDTDNIVIVGDTLTYTITFSEDIDEATVTTADFDNAGTATIGIGTITETTPGVFTVQVTPSTVGTVILRIPTGAVISDVAGNNLVVPVQDNDTVTVNDPIVNLSVVPNAGSEAGTTAITVTATASQAVVGNQTVNLALSGTANAADFTGTIPSQVTILDGQTTDSFIINVADDPAIEGTETATFTLSNPSSGINLGTTTSGNVIITDNDFAGFTIVPTSGLITTEAGGTANFSIKLTGLPTANVTIALSSSDPTEGYLSTPSLTFTPANFNTAQVVTITGIDDLDVDGNIAYTIVTAPAVSNDLNYSGLKPTDVSVTNNDNDIAQVPTPGTSVVPSGGGNLILGTNLANVIFGATTNDTVYGYAGDDYIAGRNGLDYIDGGIGNDTLLGEAGNDTLIGGAGNDTLIGGLGADSLIGGADIDAFVYNAIAEGGDAIADFAVTEKFLVSQGGFGGGLLPGLLLASQFGSGAGLSAAANATQRFIYDTTSGILRFDADGSGVGASSIVATLTNKPALSSSNIQVF